MPPKRKASNLNKQDPAQNKSQASNGPDKEQDKDSEPKVAEPASKEKTESKPVPSKNGDQNGKAQPAKKRKTDDEQASKTQRRSARGQKGAVDQRRLLEYLLSKEATALCRPKNEQDQSIDERTYTTTVPLSPFEELLAAVILSRPISHALGQRSIRTLLNKPYNFRNPKAIKTAGFEKVHQSLFDAKTQHKAKTAEQIMMLADVVPAKYSKSDEDGDMQKLRDGSGGQAEDLREDLSKNIKGLGKTGVNIFIRRVQGHWKSLYPFVDERTKASLEKLGLPGDAEDLQKLLEKNWDQLDTSDVEGGGDEEKHRMAFVRILERAIGADLEAKTDELLAAAAKD